MKLMAVTDGLMASPQITADDFEELKAQGVRTIICNRPDGEDEGQLSAARAAELAKKNGMAFRHIPMTVATLTRDVVEDFTRTLEKADGPVLAYCRSGTRSASLWALGEGLAGRMSAEEVEAFGAKLGLDFKPAAAWLARETGGGSAAQSARE